MVDETIAWFAGVDWGQRSIRPACSVLKAASLGNESSHIAARVCPSRTLRQPAIKVPDGVAAAADIHIHSLIVRL